MDRYICVHAHFYQPPRENPWLEEIESQDSAYPHHDWNERVTSECYAPNTASHVLDATGRIAKLVDNYSRISFNFGPTLLSWMETHAPEVYKAIIEADGKSRKRFSGHGSAIAQAYSHLIMPLANSGDKRTQVIWGMKDFEHRFGRKPEGMWLPETAVDLETLDLMAGQGIKFTILSPYQARRVRRIGDRRWRDVSGGKIDPKMPYSCKLPSGRTINLFFYDGPVAHDVAFGGLLKSGEAFAKRLLDLFPPDQKQPSIVHVATDGETYGHHFRFGDMALAYCLHHMESNNLARITVYGEYLEKNPPKHEVEIIENSSWGCAHGVERWKSDCGCKIGTHPRWNQRWRAPLREAMDWLRDALIPIYEKEMAHFTKDPWGARDDYIEVILDRSVRNVERFLSAHATRKLSREEKVKILKLLEMQRHSMLMYTSCGWYFNEISGIETVQVLWHAARAMQLAEDVSGSDLEPNFIKILKRAPSNIPEFKNGERVYELFVKPAIADLLRVGAHHAMSSLFEEYPKTAKIYCYTFESEMSEKMEAEGKKLAIGKARVHSDITWDEVTVCFAALHLGSGNLLAGLREHMEDDLFSSVRRKMKDTFMKGDITGVAHSIDEHFGTHKYSLWHLFRDERRKILDQILESPLRDIEKLFREIYYPTMQAMKEVRIPLPRNIAALVEFVLDTELCKSLESDKLDLDRLQELVEEVKKWSLEVDEVRLSFVASQKINKLMEKFSQTPEDVLGPKNMGAMLKILSALPLDLNLWKSQNIYFSIGKQLYGKMREKAEKGDENAKKWIEHFNNLGYHLRARVV